MCVRVCLCESICVCVRVCIPWFCVLGWLKLSGWMKPCVSSEGSRSRLAVLSGIRASLP